MSKERDFFQVLRLNADASTTAKFVALKTQPPKIKTVEWPAKKAEVTVPGMNTRPKRRQKNNEGTSSNVSEFVAPEPQSTEKLSVKHLAKRAIVAVLDTNTMSKHQQKNDKKPGMPAHQCKNEKRPKNSVRYDGKGHLPIFDKNAYASRCKNVNCNYKTNMECIKCKVHLCCVRGRNCFTDFHILEHNESD